MNNRQQWTLWGRIILTTGLSLMLVLPTLAVITGHIEGTIFDSTGVAIPGATITLHHKTTGWLRTMTTDAEGRFVFSLIPIGFYTIKVEAQGFKPIMGTVLSKSQEKVGLTLSLETGEITSLVEVAAEAPQDLDRVEPQIQTSVDETRIQDLPNLNRDPLQFVTLVPGIIGVAPNNSFLGSGSFNAHGGRGRGNNITVNNTTTSDAVISGAAGVAEPTPDETIKEIKVITQNFSAEFGRNANSQVQIVTKSGSNELHGSLYWFLQNSALNARDYFDSTGKAAPIRRNQLGFTAGGPIRKDHTFWFGHFEDLQIRGQGGTRVATVPTPEEANTISDPTSRALFSRYQIPTSPSRSVSSTSPNFTKQWSFSGQVDHRFGLKDWLAGRVAAARQEVINEGLTFIGTNLNNFGAKLSNNPVQTTLGYTHVFTERVVNDFRFAYGHYSPQLPLNTTAGLGPRIVIGGLSAFGPNEGFPQGRKQSTAQWVDTLSWVRGLHSLKAGLDLNHLNINSFLDSNVRGAATFADFAGFAAGRPLRWSQRLGTSAREFRQTNIYAFLQDDYHITTDLTLNLGLRLEVTGPITEAHNLLSNLDLDYPAPIGGAGPGPMGGFVLGGPVFARHTDWQPRVGFAWNPHRGKTVLRGGYGIVHDFIFLNPITNSRFSAPFNPSLDLARFDGEDTWARLVDGTAPSIARVRDSVGRFDPTFTNFGTIGAIDRHLKNPRVQQWNLGLQQEWPGQWITKASYVVSKSDHLLRNRMINPIRPELVRPALSEADERARLNDFVRLANGATGPSTGSSNRIDPRFNTVFLVESSGGAIYHAFEMEASKRFAKNFKIQGAYTWSRSIDDGSDALNVFSNDSVIAQNPFNTRSERAVSQFDVSHRVVIHHLFELPWAKNLGGWSKRILHGWAVNGIFQAQSGFPATLYAGTRLGISDPTLTGGGQERPNLSGSSLGFTPLPSGRNPNAIPSPCERGINRASTTNCTNTSGFPLTQPLLGTFGNLGRNVLRLSGLRQWDLVLSKITPVPREGHFIQFRFEVYNLENRPTFGRLVGDLTSPNFGTYAGTDTNSRRIQLGVKYAY